jgi:hypothetical protein
MNLGDIGMVAWAALTPFATIWQLCRFSDDKLVTSTPLMRHFGAIGWIPFKRMMTAEHQPVSAGGNQVRARYEREEHSEE